VSGLDVYLSGFLGTPEDWQPCLSCLPAARRAVAFCPRLPGHQGEPPSTAPRFVAYVDALAAQVGGLVRARSVAKVGRLVAYSLGSRIALHLAARHPNLFERLVLVAPRLPPADPRQRALRRAADARWEARWRAGPMPEVLQAWYAQPLFASQHLAGRIPPARQRAFLQRRLQHRGVNLAHTLHLLSLGRMPPLSSLPDLPLQILVGAEDLAFVGHAQAILQLAPWGRLHQVPHCGHNPLIEAPEAVAALLTG
jgi:2-succinyl-6-hydroxy-2,4-cyclohexadiene-1-carboxylate synthase